MSILETEPMASLEDLAMSMPDPLTITETENGPPLWKELLKQLPGGIIAGGAVRDWLLGVQPKDIDVFFPVGEFFAPGGFESVGGDKRDENSERAKEYTALPEIDIVMRGEVSGIQVDLVGLNIEFDNPVQLIDRFDFGITRSAFDGTLIWDTFMAKHDRDNRTVTQLLNDRPERAKVRFERFNERMGGGWTLVEGFE